MATGFHAHPHGYVLLFQLAVESFGFFAVTQSRFDYFTSLAIQPGNLLEARMIITAYNQHVRLLSSSPLVRLRLQSLLGRWEPTLLWNHYTHNPVPTLKRMLFGLMAGRGSPGGGTTLSYARQRHTLRELKQSFFAKGGAGGVLAGDHPFGWSA
jgi:hypothetical protein